MKVVFLAPPCGTASAGRSIELPGENAPRPLRSFEEPDGLSTLHGLDLLRVSAGNIFYAFTVEIVETFCLRNILCMAENPRNSLFWFVTAWVEMTAAQFIIRIIKHVCMAPKDLNSLDFAQTLNRSALFQRFVTAVTNMNPGVSSRKALSAPLPLPWKCTTPNHFAKPS